MIKKKILFITNRNIVSTCGELRLIKNRAENLYQHYGFITDFIALTNKKIEKTEDISSGGTVELIRYSKKNLLSFLSGKAKLKREVLERISNGEYAVVILSGAEVLSLVRYIHKKTPNIITIADCHGALEELIEFNSPNALKKNFRHMLYKRWKHKEENYKYFDYVLAVSESLKQYLVNNYCLNGERIYVVPCSVAEEISSFEILSKQRDESRKKYSIKDDEIVFVYSGGTSKWQCIEETVELFKEIKKKIRNAKLLLLSGDREYISKFSDRDIIIDSLRADEVKKTLPIADFTFLLRGDYITNNVAFPNKFLEYVESGAKIISTPYVKDVASFVDEYKLGYVLKNMIFEDGLVNYISHTNKYCDDYDGRVKLLRELSFKKRLQFFEGL